MRDPRATSHLVAFRELSEAFEASLHEDGGGAERQPVSAAAFSTAEGFLSALPTHFPSPEVSTTEEGEISMDWFPAPRSTFTVLSTADRTLIFATATPDRRHRGVETFTGEVPDAVLSELRRLV